MSRKSISTEIVMAAPAPDEAQRCWNRYPSYVTDDLVALATEAMGIDYDYEFGRADDLLVDTLTTIQEQDLGRLRARLLGLAGQCLAWIDEIDNQMESEAA